MKENIDKALKIMCGYDEIIPVINLPWEENDCVYATNMRVAIRVSGFDHYKYNDNEEKYGKFPNIDNTISNAGEIIGYIHIKQIREAVDDNDGCVNIHENNVQAKFMRLVADAALILGINMLSVRKSGHTLVFSTDTQDVIIIAVCDYNDYLEHRLLPMCSYVKTECYINKGLAQYGLEEYLEKEQTRKEEEERKRKEYESNHHKIWKIYVKRTDVGELLVEAPDYKTAMEIAEAQSDDAEFDDDFDYKVDEYDYEEDIDHEEIQDKYDEKRIFTPQKTEYGYQYVAVRDYKHFDE